MTTGIQSRDWAVTSEKIVEAVRRIVAVSDPLQVILFGSRARGDHQDESDVDLAVILDAPEADVQKMLPNTVLRGIRMEVTLIVVSKEEFDAHRPSLNSVYNYIDREGVVLYDREHPESAYRNAANFGGAGRSEPAIPAA